MRVFDDLTKGWFPLALLGWSGLVYFSLIPMLRTPLVQFLSRGLSRFVEFSVQIPDFLFLFSVLFLFHLLLIILL